MRQARTLWCNPYLDEERPYSADEVMVPCRSGLPGVVAQPNLVSTRLYLYEEGEDEDRSSGEFHSPVLDLDFQARLFPSSTEGHFHLYLDGLTLEWSEYKDLLRALVKARVIEEGFYQSALEREMTCVRPPGVRKEAA